MGSWQKLVRCQQCRDNCKTRKSESPKIKTQFDDIHLVASKRISGMFDSMSQIIVLTQVSEICWKPQDGKILILLCQYLVTQLLSNNYIYLNESTRISKVSLLTPQISLPNPSPASSNSRIAN